MQEPKVYYLRKVKKNAPLLIAALLILLSSCHSAADQQQQAQGPMPVPVVKINQVPATTYREYTATVEGKVNVEIRAQVDGYLEEIFVDEGAYVKAGQPLFRINAQRYSELLNNANSNLSAAKAAMNKAKIEVERLQPLVENNIVSDVQLKTAQSAYEAAKANVAQAQAMSQNAGINVGYTLIKAPVSGYVGRIPYKKGSLVGRAEPQALTVISDVSEVYAYFSMSEADYLKFENHYPGATVEEKIKQLPPVALKLADNSIYSEKGRIEVVQGQFDKTMGAITFRAAFPNAKGLLRTGSTGKVQLPEAHSAVLAVPQEATFEIQDKVFVFTVSADNKVMSQPIQIADKNSKYYFVESGIKAGDRIAYSGLDHLKDSTVIAPQLLSMDSLLQVNPI